MRLSPLHLARTQAVGPFVPEIMLPAQFGQRARLDFPETRLMLAVLENALDDLRLRANDRESKYRRDTVAWFREESDREPFSFARICDVLGLSAAAIRAALERQQFRITGSIRFAADRGTRVGVCPSAVDTARRHRPRKRNSPHSPLWEA